MIKNLCQKNFIKLVIQKKIGKVEQLSSKVTQLNAKERLSYRTLGAFWIVIKKLLKLFWRAGVEEIKPPMRQLMSEDEFSKRSLIGDEEEYDDMSQLINEFGEGLEEEEVDSVFDNLKENKRN